MIRAEGTEGPLVAARALPGDKRTTSIFAASLTLSVGSLMAPALVAGLLVAAVVTPSEHDRRLRAAGEDELCSRVTPRTLRAMGSRRKGDSTMDGAIHWPIGLSSDARLFSSLTLPEAQCRVRVLLPPLAAEAGLRWSEIAEQAGVALDGHIPLRDLLKARGRKFDAWHPNGQVSSETVDRILRAVLEATASSAAKLIFWGCTTKDRSGRDWEPLAFRFSARGRAGTTEPIWFPEWSTFASFATS
jgi:hypothetical protein